MNQQINTSKTYMQKNILMGKISKICKGLRMPDFIKETSDENSKALSHDILLSVSESSYRGGESNVFQGTAKTPQGIDFWARTTKAFAHPWEALRAIERRTPFTPFSPRQRRQAPQKSWFFFLFFF